MQGRTPFPAAPSGCSCPAGTYNPGSVHEPYCALSHPASRAIAWHVSTTVSGRYVELGLVAPKGDVALARVFAPEEIEDIIAALVSAVEAVRAGHTYEELV